MFFIKIIAAFFLSYLGTVLYIKYYKGTWLWKLGNLHLFAAVASSAVIFLISILTDPVIWLHIFLSIVTALILVSLFNWFSLNKLSLLPIIPKTWLLILGLSIPIYFIIDASFNPYPTWEIDFGEDFQNLPNYLVFFATLLTAFLLYLTLTSQLNTAKKQDKVNQISEFENRFFKFIDYHRENVNLLKYRDPKNSGEKNFKGNQVFTVVYYEIRDLLEELFSKHDFNSPDEIREAVNFIYQCVFYGAGKDSLPILEKRFSNKDYFDSIDFKDKKAIYKDSIDSDENFRPKYYSGHVRRLGHYYRNIFQAVTYVDNQQFLSEKEKYDYVKILRAQMSVYEQGVFFLNSLTDLGDIWEIKRLRDTKIANLHKATLFKKLLITKYDLVRNTLNDDGLIFGKINIKSFYPLLNLERETEFSQSGSLKLRDQSIKICRLCFNKRYIKYLDPEIDEKLVIKDLIQEYPDFAKN